jgi:AAHS family 4-hydroxybenzoate transporter-like MFS transporter
MTATMYHFGAVAGGLAMSMLLDRWGFLAVAVLLALAGPALLLIGLPGVPTVVLSLLVAFAGFCVLGAQFGSNAGSGLIYPTAFRSKGVGMAFGVGRIGSIIGPLLGAALIAMKLPLPSLLLAIAVPVMLGACAAFFLARFSYLRFGGWALDESRVHAEDVSPAGAAASGVA